jgi:TfoX/Sxy family transcriptional regulator of competence genes
VAYDEMLAERVRGILGRRRGVTEKKMFGGLCFLVNGNMACGVEKENLVIRVGPEHYERALSKPSARPMDFTGRSLKGFVYVSPQGYRTKATLKKWVDLGAGFAKSLPKKG